MKARFAATFLAALLLMGATSKDEIRSTLVTVEGTVIGVGSAQGEGGLEVLSVTLSPKDSEGKELNLLLAPKTTLDEVEFHVEEGDRVQARVFPSEDGPAKVHKVRNLTRHTMLRLRTLHRIPLWDGVGTWQGGPGQGHMGGRGGHGQHGQRGNGPGR
jgi:hypothetical protein